MISRSSNAEPSSSSSGHRHPALLRFSTRQEYYVLPAIPALAILIAGWLTQPFGVVISRASENLPQHAKKPCNTPSGQRHPSVPPTLHHRPPGFRHPLRHRRTLHPSPGPHPRPQHRPRHPPHRTHPPTTPSAWATSSTSTPAPGPLPPASNPRSAKPFPRPLTAFILRKKPKPHAANLASPLEPSVSSRRPLGLQTFAPVLSSAQLAQAIAPQVHPQDLIVLHGEYEAGSTLAFYLQRPSSYRAQPNTAQFIHILEGRSSNLWYGSFFPTPPKSSKPHKPSPPNGRAPSASSSGNP